MASDECDSCDGEGVIETGPHCTRGSCDDCGGCYKEYPCPDCSKEPDEPDWDSMADDRKELAILRGQDNEVDWESPE